MESPTCTLPPLRRRIAVARCYILIFDPVVVVLIAVIAIMKADYYFSIFDFIPITAIAWSLIWNFISISLLYKNRRIYPPGVDIGMDFIAWGLCWALGIIWLLINAYAGADAWSSEYCYQSYYGDTGNCTEGDIQYGIRIAAPGITILIGAAHFAIFVMACIVTHNARKAKKMEARFSSMEEDGPEIQR